MASNQNDTISDETAELDVKLESASCFRESWLTHEKYSEWIAYGSNHKKVYCTYCCIEFAANRGSLVKHYRNQKHIDCAKSHTRLLKIIDVQKDPDVPMTAGERDIILNAFCDNDLARGLENLIAGLVGQEAGLLFPTHVMANLVAVFTHCPARGAPVIVGKESQIATENKEGITRLGGLRLITQPTFEDGSFEMPRMQGLTPDADAPGLVCVECAHMNRGGTIPSSEWLNQIATFCELYSFKCHFDGTRLLAAAVARDVTPASFTKNYDSVMVSITKGLGAPTGAILCGSNEFIRSARRTRDELGGKLDQPNAIAAIAMKNITAYKISLRTTHLTACKIGQHLSEIQDSNFNVVLVSIATNIIRLEFDSSQANTQHFIDSLAKRDERIDEDTSVLVSRVDKSSIIMEIHPKISGHHITRLCRKITAVLEQSNRQVGS